jgi:hypothetical protein
MTGTGLRTGITFEGEKRAAACGTDFVKQVPGSGGSGFADDVFI